MTLSTDTETDSELTEIQPEATRQKERKKNLKQSKLSFLRPVKLVIYPQKSRISVIKIQMMTFFIPNVTMSAFHFLLNSHPHRNVGVEEKENTSEVTKTCEKPKRSVVWHFLKPDPVNPSSSIKLCSLCKKHINTSNNTTNARTHLLKNHAKEFEKYLKLINDVDESSTTSDAESTIEPETMNNEKTVPTSTALHFNVENDGGSTQQKQVFEKVKTDFFYLLG